MKPSKSADELAAQIGVSGRTIERTRAVLASNDEEVKGQLLSGQLTTHAAYEQVKQAERAKVDSAPLITVSNDHTPKPVRESYSIDRWSAMDTKARFEVVAAGLKAESSLNKQDTDNIEWAKWSWNPITGCLHDCPYCYARDIANRFYAQKFTPTFLPWRLSAPAQQAVPTQADTELGYRNIFTCSMADLFGKWVPAEWIEAVLNVVRENPQWNFLFLWPEDWPEGVEPDDSEETDESDESTDDAE